MIFMLSIFSMVLASYLYLDILILKIFMKCLINGVEIPTYYVRSNTD